MHTFLYGCLLVGCHSVVSITSTILAALYWSKVVEASSNLLALNFLRSMHSTHSTPWHSTCNDFHVATTYLVHLLFVSPCPCFFLALFVPHAGLDMLLVSVHAYDIVKSCNHLPPILDQSIYWALQLGGPFSSSGALHLLPIGATNTCHSIVGGKIVGPILNSSYYCMVWKNICNW
jgi:hypothetical protein